MRSPTSKYGAIKHDADSYKCFSVTVALVNSLDLTGLYGSP